VGCKVWVGVLWAHGFLLCLSHLGVGFARRPVALGGGCPPSKELTPLVIRLCRVSPGGDAVCFGCSVGPWLVSRPDRVATVAVPHDLRPRVGFSGCAILCAGPWARILLTEGGL